MSPIPRRMVGAGIQGQGRGLQALLARQLGVRADGGEVRRHDRAVCGGELSSAHHVTCTTDNYFPHKPDESGLLCRQVGCDDSFNMVLDSDDVVSLPFIGNRIKEQALRIPSARQGTAAKEDIPDDLFIQPVSIPRSINRRARHCCSILRDERR